MELVLVHALNGTCVRVGGGDTFHIDVCVSENDKDDRRARVRPVVVARRRFPGTARRPAELPSCEPTCFFAGRDARMHSEPHERHPHDPHHLDVLQHFGAHDLSLRQGQISAILSWTFIYPEVEYFFFTPKTRNDGRIPNVKQIEYI